MPRISALLLLLAGCGSGLAEVVTPPGRAPATTPEQASDGDGDGVSDDVDNCVDAANPDQDDIDGNGVGDACDGPPDLDDDGVPDYLDNCPDAANGGQADADDDGYGDACDTCPDLVDHDQADSDGDGVGDACPCDACGDDWCVLPEGGGVTCQVDCVPERQGAEGMCCPMGTRLDPVSGACPLPDLIVDAARVEASLTLTDVTFAADDCAVLEGCVDAAGDRRVLSFDATIANVGEGDLFLGTIEDGGLTTSECKGDHLAAVITYEIVAADGTVAAPGHATSGCLRDQEPWTGGGAARYTCADQGITRGWASTLPRALDCQGVDVTDLAPGTWTLRLEVDADGVLAESDDTNNLTEVQVVIP